MVIRCSTAGSGAVKGEFTFSHLTTISRIGDADDGDFSDLAFIGVYAAGKEGAAQQNKQDPAYLFFCHISLFLHDFFIPFFFVIF